MTKPSLFFWQLPLFVFLTVCPRVEADPASAPVAPQACAEQIQFRARFDLNEGEEELIKLHRLNQELERRWKEGTLTREAVFSEGWAELTDRVVTDKNGQPQRFRELRLTHAKTGLYLPAKKKKGDSPPELIDASEFDGVMIALPGIGFTVSVAKSLFEIAGTFIKGSNAALTLPNGKKFRLAGIPMDAPLNGMGEDAPYAFGHPDAVLAVVRYAVLILRPFYPGLPLFGIGRSQGALNWLEMAAHYGELAGVIALNPSNPHPEIVRECIRLHEDMALPENREKAEAEGFDCNFHVRSWSAHADYTPLYRVLRMPSKVPALLLLGNKDSSYPQPLYRESWEEWISQQPSMRSVRVFPGGHNLWMRPKGEGAELYERVVRSMRDFMVPLLAVDPR